MMKVNVKKAANSKEKGSGTQTITSMFKRQIATAKKQSTTAKKNSPSKSTSSDDDVKIIKVETESSYFNKNSSDGKSSEIRRKLSLRKSLSSKIKERESPKIVTAEISCIQSDVVEIEEYWQESSQKENCDRIEQGKQNLNVRKRKSDILPENDIKKKNKIDDNEFHIAFTQLSNQHNVADENSAMDSMSKMENSSDPITLSETVNTKNINNIPSSLLEKDNIENTAQQSSDIKKHNNESNLNDMVSDENKQKTSHLLDEQRKSTSGTYPKISAENHGEEDNSQQNDDVEQVDDKGLEFRTPYYLENFRTVLNTVFEDENNLKLYNNDDMKVISTFNEISEPAQKLYLRIFCRKWVWLPMSKMNYPGISEDLLPVVDELVQKKMLITDDDLTDLSVTLKLLSGGDIKTLGKTYHINTTSQNKIDIIDLLLKKTKQNTIGSMFKMSGNSLETVMLKRAKKLLGRCICLDEDPRNVFARTLMLFSLTDTVLDEDSSSQSLQLFQMLRVNIGQVTYPKFTVNKQTQIFSDREALLRFCDASLLEFDILTKIDRNKYTEAYGIYLEALKKYDQLNQNKHISKFDNNLPVFLRPYTACGIYTRALNQGVEILQRRKDYQTAVDLLRKLLSQKCYCQHYRGHWWERLALNYDVHLKKQDLALKAVEDGLADNLVRTGRRLALYQRAEKICNTAKSKYKSRMKYFDHEKLLELPVVTIEGQTLSDGIEGQRYKFMIQYSQGQSETDDIAFCNVEEVVLDHYKHNGFTDGIHAEGSVVSYLFGLFFWDILFMDVPDVFHSPYQTHPLDMHTEDFYTSRQTHIDDRLEIIHNSSVEELKDIIEKTWVEHEGTMCAGLNWERFNNLQHVQGLAECIGGKTLSGILGRYVKDPRHTRSGFPDLTLWNTDTKKFKICEVKGPGDKLSHKQIMWLDYLLKLGVDAEVCHVKAVGSKRLKKTASTT